MVGVCGQDLLILREVWKDVLPGIQHRSKRSTLHVTVAVAKTIYSMPTCSAWGIYE